MEKSKILRLSDLVKPVASATAFFTTLVILSVAYAGWSTPVPTVATGQALTKALWDNLANELADHDSKIAGQEAKTANISSVGGNVGV
ncbi:MAG: hypothetical protein QG650_693 [Patescibacteria group bacterium]|nr:hypothetical protein [Patescibacteria group bacterium]